MFYFIEIYLFSVSLYDNKGELSSFIVKKMFVELDLKSDSHLPKKFCIICFIESPLKRMKEAFYFILKALFVLKIFKVLSFWSCGRNGLIRKIQLTSKLITSKPGQQIITINIFPSISRSKFNWTMKLSQLTEYNKIIIFLQKLWRKRARETSSRPLLIFKKSLKWSKSKWSAA